MIGATTSGVALHQSLIASLGVKVGCGGWGCLASSWYCQPLQLSMTSPQAGAGCVHSACSPTQPAVFLRAARSLPCRLWCARRLPRCWRLMCWPPSPATPSS